MPVAPTNLRPPWRSAPCSGAVSFSRGFSLIELAMVMLVIATLGAIAAPRYAEGVSRYRVSMSAQRLAGDIDALRRTCRAASCSGELVLEPDQDRYAWSVLSSMIPSSGEFRLAKPPLESSIEPGALVRVRFDAFGMPSEGGEISLASGYFGCNVSVDRSTGETHIGEVYARRSPARIHR